MLPGIHQNFDQQQAPAFFARGPSPLARLTFFTALSLALMATDSRLQYLTSIRATLMNLLHPLQVVANAPSELFESTDKYFTTHHQLLKENTQLKQQVLMQNISLQKLNLLALENTNLRDLLHAQQALAETSTLAEILHVGRDSFTKKIIVNRGKNHHIVTGAAAVDATGVVGQVTRTYPSSSEITLITDKSLAIPIQIERNGLRAIAFGRGRDNTLDLPYLPANVDIRRGDKLVTSGIDGVYPSGLTVATVTEIKTSPESPFAHIVCVPTGGIEHSRQVLIVNLPQSDEPDVTANETAADDSKKAAAAASAKDATVRSASTKPPHAQPAAAPAQAKPEQPKKAEPPAAEKPQNKPLTPDQSQHRAQ